MFLDSEYLFWLSFFIAVDFTCPHLLDLLTCLSSVFTHLCLTWHVFERHVLLEVSDLYSPFIPGLFQSLRFFSDFSRVFTNMILLSTGLLWQSLCLHCFWWCFLISCLLFGFGVTWTALLVVCTLHSLFGLFLLSIVRGLARCCYAVRRLFDLPVTLFLLRLFLINCD